MSDSRILLLEDEKNLGSTLQDRLVHEGYQVVWCRTAEAAQREIRSSAFQLALLDVGLPDGSGFDVGKFLREAQPATAVIFLTAFGTASDRIKGLELGAEDYVVKPFHLKELMLRIRNGLKRANYLNQHLTGGSNQVQIGRAMIYFSRFEARVGDGIVPLTHKETSLLRFMVERKGCVVSRDEILNHVWAEDEYPTPRTVDNFIMRLRRLVELNPEQPEVIRSVRGIGYQLLI